MNKLLNKIKINYKKIFNNIIKNKLKYLQIKCMNF